MLDVPEGLRAPLPPAPRLQPGTSIDPRSFAPTSTPNQAPRTDFTVLKGAGTEDKAPELEFTGARLASGRVPLQVEGRKGPGAAGGAGMPLEAARAGAEAAAAGGRGSAQLLVPHASARIAGVLDKLAPLIEELRKPLPAPKAPSVREQPEAWLARSSLARGAPPDPGIQMRRFLWADVLDGRPPARAHDGEGTYAVYHTLEVDQHLRITFHTLVSALSSRPRAAPPAGDAFALSAVPVWDAPAAASGTSAPDAATATLVLDERIHVQKRALLEQMDQVRERADQAAHRSQEALARRLARRRARVASWPAWATSTGFKALRVQAQFGQARIQAVRGMRRGMVEVPDKLFSSGLRVQYHLVDRLARRSLLEGMRDPTTMSQEQRSVTLFLTAVLSLGLVLLLNSFFALATPEFAGVYRHMLADATLQFVGLIGAPVIIEPLLIFSTQAYGPVLAFTAFFLGKMLGAWVLYLMGDSLHQALEKKRKPGRMSDLMDWLKANTNKYGLAILILDNSLPLAPDQLMLVFAVSGIKFRTWMLGIGIGTVIKFSAVIGGTMLLGPEVIEGFFSNPFGIFG